jgi:membrane protease YdiL (CAAX protease family)
LPYALVLQVLITLVVWAGAMALELPFDSSSMQSLIMLGAVVYLLVIPGLWLAWIAFGQASLADMGHAGPPLTALRELGLGLLLGTGLLSLIVGLGAALGAYEIGAADWRAGLSAQAIWLPVLFVAAYYEEVLLRGWVQQDLGRSRPWVGLVLSSVIFAVLHGTNPGVADNGLVGALVILANIFLAGLILGAVFLISGKLWLPTGLHLGWNWATAVVFGLPVSGFRLPSLLESEAVEGSGLMSGGAFGPEGSLPSLAVLTVVAAVLVSLALKRGLQAPIVARHAPSAEDGAIIVASGPETT